MYSALQFKMFILLEFYGKTNLEAAYIDQILDTLQDLVTAAIPYLVTSKQDKDKKVTLPFLYYSVIPHRERTSVFCIQQRCRPGNAP